MLLCSRVVAAHMSSLGMDGEIDETSVLELKLGCVVGSFSLSCILSNQGNLMEKLWFWDKFDWVKEVHFRGGGEIASVMGTLISFCYISNANVYSIRK